MECDRVRGVAAAPTAQLGAKRPVNVFHKCEEILVEESYIAKRSAAVERCARACPKDEVIGIKLPTIRLTMTAWHCDTGPGHLISRAIQARRIVPTHHLARRGARPGILIKGLHEAL